MNRALICLWIVVLFGVSPAYAQNAQVIGNVKDDSGAVVPGVTATARNAATGLLRTSVTDATGTFTLPALPPGTYAVSVELQGFAGQTRPNVILSIDQTATLSFVLKPAALSETLTVTGESPVIDTTQSAAATSVSTAQIQNLPVATRRWIDLAMLTPGTSQDAIRAAPYRGNVNMGSGLKFYANGFNVDGTSNNWAEMGEPRQNYAMDAVQEFKVETAAYKAEYGWATGGVLNVVTKSGGNHFTGDAFNFFRNAALSAPQDFQSPKPPYFRDQFGGALGGPIVQNRAQFFAQYERTDEKQYQTVNTSSVWPQYNGTFPQKNYFQMFDARLDHQLTANQSVFLRYADERDSRPYSTVGGTTPLSDSQDRSKPSYSLVAGHTWVLSKNALNDFRFQYAWARFVLAAPGSLLSPSGGAFEPGDFSEARLSVLTPVFQYPSITVGQGNTQMGQETRVQFKDDFTYNISGLGGGHQLKMGIDYSRIPFAADNTGSVTGTWTFPKDTPYDANNPSTFPTQYTQGLPTFAKITVQHVSTYIEDDWRASPRVTLNMGLRWDLQPGGFNENIQTEMQQIANVLGPGFGTLSPSGTGYPLAVPFIDESARGYWKDFGPRVGVAWDVSGDGRTNLHSAFGVFTDNIQILSNFNELTWPQSQSIVISRPTYPDPLQGLSRTQFLSKNPPNISVLANNFRPARALQFDGGLTQMLPGHMAGTVEVVLAHRYDDRDSVDINLPDQITGIKPYPQFGRVTSSQPVQYDNYAALYLKVEKQLTSHFQLLFSYSETRATECDMSNALGGVYGFGQVCGPDPAERRHRATFSGIAQLPYQIQLSTIADYRSSLPFNPTTSFDLNHDGYTGDLPPGLGFDAGCRNMDIGAINAFRASRGLAAVDASAVSCPTFFNVDMRVTKTFSLFRSRRLSVIGQLLNVFNRSQLGPAVTNPGSTLFGQSIGLLPYIVNGPSRQAELALRMDF